MYIYYISFQILYIYISKYNNNLHINLNIISKKNIQKNEKEQKFIFNSITNYKIDNKVDNKVY